MDTKSPAPVGNAEAENPLNDQRPWHEIWNPLRLKTTAAPAQGFYYQALLFFYFYKSAISDKVAACIPLLVLFGEPGEGGGSIIYFFLVGAVITFAFLFTLMHYNQVRITTGLTFFKLTLYSEWLRESRIWKLISVLMVLWFFGFLAVVWYSEKQQSERNAKNNVTATATIAGVQLIKIDENAPQPWKFAFVILLGAYVYELYNIVTYEDAYDEMMLPSWDSISKMYPGEYKTALTKKIVLEEAQHGFGASFLLRNGHAPFQFEPNLDIKPDGMMWALTDSATHLKNAMLVCGFIAAQMKKRPLDPTETATKTVEEFRKDDRWKDDPKLKTDSLPFEYVISPPFFVLNGLITLPSCASFCISSYKSIRTNS